MSEQTSMIWEHFFTLLTIKLHFLVKPVDAMIQIVFFFQTAFQTARTSKWFQQLYILVLIKSLKKLFMKFLNVSEETGMIWEHFFTLLTIKLHFLVKPVNVIIQIVFSSKHLSALLTLPTLLPMNVSLMICQVSFSLKEFIAKKADNFRWDLLAMHL